MRRLSIFSSENIAVFARLPLRTYVWLAFAGLCLAAVALVSSAVLDQLSTRFKRPMPPFAESGEVMILGDSTLLYLKTWDYPVRDFALPSCGYLMQKNLFDAISPEMPNLHVLIMSLSVLDYYKRDVEAREGDYRDLIDWGVPWRELPGLTPAERVSAFARYNTLTAPFLIGPKLDIKTLSRVSMIPLEFRPDDSSPKDFEAQPKGPARPKPKADQKSAPVESAKKTAAPAAQPKPEDIRMTAAPSAGNASLTNEESATLASYARLLLPYVKEATGQPRAHHKNALFDILASCRERGIQPVFIKVPSPGGLLWSAPITQQRTNDLYFEIQSGFADLAIPVWDAEKEQGIYSIDQFKDHLHLNEKGLAKFNAFLNAKLAALPLPGPGASSMDSIRRTGNLLLPASPADRPTPWVRSTGVKVAKVDVPGKLRGTARFATRIVLPPGGRIYLATESPVLPGTTCAARLWLWADRPGPTDVRFVLARHGDDSAWEGAAASAKELSRDPKQFELNVSFAHRHPKMRLEVRNESTQEQVIYMAAPSITNQYTGGGPPEVEKH